MFGKNLLTTKKVITLFHLFLNFWIYTHSNAFNFKRLKYGISDSSFPTDAYRPDEYLEECVEHMPMPKHIHHISPSTLVSSTPHHIPTESGWPHVTHIDHRDFSRPSFFGLFKQERSQPLWDSKNPPNRSAHIGNGQPPPSKISKPRRNYHI